MGLKKWFKSLVGDMNDYNFTGEDGKIKFSKGDTLAIDIGYEKRYDKEGRVRLDHRKEKSFRFDILSYKNGRIKDYNDNRVVMGKDEKFSIIVSGGKPTIENRRMGGLMIYGDVADPIGQIIGEYEGVFDESMLNEDCFEIEFDVEYHQWYRKQIEGRPYKCEDDIRMSYQNVKKVAIIREGVDNMRVIVLK